MLIWFIAALTFLVCVIAWHLWQGITASEAIGLFVAVTIAFSAQVHYIYDKNTTDHYLISGYVTSKVYRSSYTYGSGDHKHTEPPHYLVEQSPYPPSRTVSIDRRYIGEDSTVRSERCYGECSLHYPSGEPPNNTWLVADFKGSPTPAFAIDTNPTKYDKTRPGEASAVWQKYYNPVRVSDDVVYSERADTKIPYFKITDFNHVTRLIAPGASKEQIEKLALINADLAEYTNISVSLVVTADEMYFEKLKRSWSKGKANDFVVVVYSPDGKTIRNVDILAWGNYNLQENVSEAIAGVGMVDIDKILYVLGHVIKEGPTFSTKSFEKYSFLSIKIPASDYGFIITYQLILIVYLMNLLRLDPSTKTQKANWHDIGETWDKHGNPSSRSYYFHPFSCSGVFFFYTTIPFGFFKLWEFIFDSISGAHAS